MTILQILNSFFYLLIYPYLVRVLGGESYGTFIFGTSVATYFFFLINFGFDLPATKAVAENAYNKNKLEDILSSVFTSKSYLFIISAIIFSILLFTLPALSKNRILFILCFISIYSSVLFPQWYFQGIQRMKIVTYIQLGVKLASLPIILYFVKKSSDLLIYTLIVTITNLFGAFIAFFIITFKHRLILKWKAIKDIKIWFRDAKPFFYSSLAGTIKEQSIPVIIGSFFGMKEVAIYDLANKIIIIPRTIFMSVNSAIFPKLIVNINSVLVKKIIRLEAFVSMTTVLFIILFGKFIVNILGGNEMKDSYFLSILLSVTIVSWLIVGAYINFVFIPHNKSRYIAVNQLIAMITFFVFCIGGLLLYKNILIFGMAIALSGLIEIVYCIYITRKNKFLE